MKRLIRIFMWILFFLALFIAIAYFLPQQVYVERKLTINASPKTIFSQINDLHSWERWSLWNRMDPNMQVKYFNNGVGVGAVYSWTSENRNIGSGELKILESVKYDSIVFLFDFKEQGEAISRFILNSDDEETLTTWSLSYDLGYNPAARWMGLFMDNFIGKDFEESLINLNAVCKIQEEENVYIVELDSLDGFYFAGIRNIIDKKNISLNMARMYEEIMHNLETSDIEISGKPYAVYHSVIEDEIDLECGIPVAELAEGNKGILTGRFSEIKCATTDYYGDYQKLEEGHMALQQWIKKRRFNMAGPPMEMYYTDPESESDTSKWLTKIYYPLR